MTRSWASAAVLCLILLAQDVAAHRLRAAISTVLFNTRTERIEIMHRFYVHDAEQLLAEMLPDRVDLHDVPEHRYRFAVYVHERFSLATPSGTPLPLTLVGAELDGEHLWVYQKTPLPPALEGLTVRHDAVRDLWPDQVNTVNVERGGRVRTLQFSGTDGALTVAFDPPGPGSSAREQR